MMTRSKARAADDRSQMGFTADEFREAYKAVVAANLADAEKKSPLIKMKTQQLKSYMMMAGVHKKYHELLHEIQKLPLCDLYIAAEDLWGISCDTIEGKTINDVFRNLIFAVRKL